MCCDSASSSCRVPSWHPFRDPDQSLRKALDLFWNCTSYTRIHTHSLSIDFCALSIFDAARPLHLLLQTTTCSMATTCRGSIKTSLNVTTPDSMLISLPDTVKGRDIKMLERRALIVNRQADSYDASPHEILQTPCTALLPS